jgi:hypothetical protein
MHPGLLRQSIAKHDFAFQSEYGPLTFHKYGHHGSLFGLRSYFRPVPAEQDHLRFIFASDDMDLYVKGKRAVQLPRRTAIKVKPGVPIDLRATSRTKVYAIGLHADEVEVQWQAKMKLEGFASRFEEEQFKKEWATFWSKEPDYIHLATEGGMDPERNAERIITKYPGLIIAPPFSNHKGGLSPDGWMLRPGRGSGVFSIGNDFYVSYEMRSTGGPGSGGEVPHDHEYSIEGRLIIEPGLRIMSAERGRPLASGESYIAKGDEVILALPDSGLYHHTEIVSVPMMSTTFQLISPPGDRRDEQGAYICAVPLRREERIYRLLLVFKSGARGLLPAQRSMLEELVR